MSNLSPEKKEISLLKQKIAVLHYELREMLKAIENHRREFSSPIHVSEFDREVTLDFDDPLYPYCPFRLTKGELTKYMEGGDKKE